MAVLRAGPLRRLWLKLHRWLGLCLAVLIVPISISGAALVWHDALDNALNPARYRVSGPEAALPPSVYLERAATALGPQFKVTGLRYPDAAVAPVRVAARGPAGPGEGRPRLMTVFLDPPTGTVLEAVDFRSSLVGVVHVLHGNLLIPGPFGRQVVGWVGAAMLVMSLTGLWLWWPRNGSLRRAFRWKRAPETSANLHHLFGFWISVPLAVVSLTGIYLSFPQAARSVTAALAPMAPPAPRPGSGEVASNPKLTPERARELAQAAEPAAKLVALFLPAAEGRQAAPERGGDAARAREAAPSWRVQLRAADGGLVDLSVDDGDASVRRSPVSPAGNRAAALIRAIHEGHAGPLWAAIVFLTGVLPLVFAVTGLLIWLRRPGERALPGRRTRSAALRPAE